MNKVFTGILLLGFLVLIGRLVDVSIIRGNYFERLADQNRIRKVPIHAPRGEIFDRLGNKLTQNVQDKEVLRFEGGKPVNKVPGKEAVSDPVIEVLVSNYSREYPQGNLVSHVTGFVGESSREEVGKAGCLRPGGVSDPVGSGSVYALGDVVGRMGVEQSLDCVLRGVNGEELVEVDNQGSKVRVLGRREPRVGSDLEISIDLGLQRVATDALAGRPGAVVASDPRTGEILALVSSPTFDPNTLSNLYSLLSNDPNKPLFNRAIGGRYPPGSTFKIVTSAAGLESGAVSERTLYLDPGIITIGSFNYSNWYFTKFGRLEGEIGIVRAITRSTDTFFYKVGEWVGVVKLAEYAHRFGFGKKTGIEISGETDGIVPTPEWKERERGERWFLGNTYHMAIGQGDVAASPLQVNTMTSVIANGGRLCRPSVLKGGDLRNDKFQISNFKCEEIGVSQKTVDLIKQGMIGACSPGGTSGIFAGFKFGEREIKVACKTGTAEFDLPAQAGETSEYDLKKAHAWFTAFAPAYAEASAGEPEIVVTVLVEAGGEGSSVAAPIAKQVLEEWFGR